MSVRSITDVIFLVAGLALLVWFQDRIPPNDARKPSEVAEAIDFAALFSQVNRQTMDQIHARVVQSPSRLSGTQGDQNLSLWIEGEFNRLDLDVVVQTYPVTVPVTRWCTIADECGTMFPGIRLAPFWPNLVRTCTTVPEGVVGQVIDVGSGSMADLEGQAIDGAIALVTMKGGLAWLDAAKLGASAILFRAGSNPSDYQDKFLNFPADLPRFFVTGPAASLVGKRVRISARVDWQIRQARSVFGVLDPPGGRASEAVTLLAHTDAWSMVPELAPGYHDGASIASLVAAARALSPQRSGLARSIVFAALSGHYQVAEGSRRMTDALGISASLDANLSAIQGRLEAAKDRMAALEAVVCVFNTGHDGSDPNDADVELWAEHDKPGQKALGSVVGRILEGYLATARNTAEMSRLTWVEAGRPSRGPLFEAQLRGAARVRRALAAAGADLHEMRRSFGDVFDASGCKQLLDSTLKDELAYTRTVVQNERDTLGLARLLGSFKKNYFFFLAPSSSEPQLGYSGDVTLCSMLERARNAVVATWLAWRGVEVNDPTVYSNYLANRRQKGYLPWTRPSHPAARIDLNPSSIVGLAGHAAFDVRGRVYPDAYQTPLDLDVSPVGLGVQTQLLAGLAAQMGAGAEPMDAPGKASTGMVRWFSDYGGEVMTAGASNALLPDQSVSDAMVVLKGAYGGPFYIQKTRDGSFRYPAVEAAGADWVTADAYTLDERTGQITGAKDLGPEGERFPTLMFKYGKGGLYEEPQTRVTILLSRFAPTDIYRTIGPDGEPLTLDILDAHFRNRPAKFSLSEYWEQGATMFIEPGNGGYLVLKDMPKRGRFFGRKGLSTTGVLLGHTLNGIAPGEKVDFWGPGYLAGRQRRVTFQEADAAVSVGAINRYRLMNQKRTGVADPIAVELTRRADELLAKGSKAFDAGRYERSYQDLSASLAISTRAYPAIRAAVYDALSGILLYLFLLVPLSYFAERLLFDFGDIRGRLAGMFAIFLFGFTIIRLTHPAYQLMSSSLIVLVGFVIFILCLLILSFVTGKFAERLRSLRQMGVQNGESQSDVSRLSASGAAFNLGISNMRKRKARTAYTVTTLILISFCLVCFTAPRPTLRDRKIAVGPAAFNGLILRRSGDISAARQRFGDRADVVARRAVLRSTSVSHVSARGGLREAPLQGLVYIQSDESRVNRLDETLLPGSEWFDQGQTDFCYISDTTADQLGIDAGLVVQQNLQVTLDGRRRWVRGVFDARMVETLRDPDGESFLPEVSGLQSAGERRRQQTNRLAGRPGAQDMTVQYVPGSAVALLPLDPEAGGEFNSAVVLFLDQSYGSMCEIIDRMLDRTPTFVRYAIDGLAFFGLRLRSVGLEGYVDIVVPLLVASCIVFNTMLGNVHERRKEIAIYSAVGLSPRHVFYLFLAESLVYAVLGVVGGYLFALTLQWLSQYMGGWFELNIDYSSRSAVYVSMTLMVAVVISSFVPARQAARVASPAERGGQNVPMPVAPGQLRFELPFTYLGPDILAAVPFLTTWLEARGEDSSGEFAAEVPHVSVDWSGTQPVFTVASQVWLRPCDLGVSQTVRISIGPSDEPTIYVVHVEIDQLTGSPAAWHRTNARFVRLMRRHLLSWRTIPLRRKQALFEHSSNCFKATTGESDDVGVLV